MLKLECFFIGLFVFGLESNGVAVVPVCCVLYAFLDNVPYENIDDNAVVTLIPLISIRKKFDKEAYLKSAEAILFPSLLRPWIR